MVLFFTVWELGFRTFGLPTFGLSCFSLPIGLTTFGCGLAKRLATLNIVFALGFEIGVIVLWVNSFVLLGTTCLKFWLVFLCDFIQKSNLFLV